MSNATPVPAASRGGGDQWDDEGWDAGGSDGGAGGGGAGGGGTNLTDVLTGAGADELDANEGWDDGRSKQQLCRSLTSHLC